MPVPTLPPMLALGLHDELQRAAAEHLLTAARGLRQAIVDDRVAAAERGVYSAEIHEAILRARLYEITTPKAFGGLELPLAVLMAVVVELASADPSAGWAYALASQHTTTVAAHWPAAVQAIALGNGPFLAPHQFAWSGTVREEEGGFRIDGTYPYCSGAPYSTHVMITSSVAESARRVTLLVPREGYEVLDDWHGSFGMKASGSNSVCFRDHFVPADWAIDGIGDDLAVDPPGVALHGSHLYYGRLDAYHPTGLAAVAVGTARAAIDEMERVVLSGASKNRSGGKRYDPLYQQTVGAATARSDAAFALVLSAAGAYEAAGERQHQGGAPISRGELAAIAGFGPTAIDLAWQAVEAVFIHIGSSHVADGSRMEGLYRDLSTLRTHGRFHLDSVHVARGASELAAR